MRSRISAALFLSACASTASAHSIKQRVGGYSDNQGVSRQRIGYDLGVESGASTRIDGLTGSSINMSATIDKYSNSEEPSKYDTAVYGGATRQNRSGSLGATQTWDKITETRIMGNFATDGAITSRSLAAGASQWLAHETVRLSFDVSRTVVEAPLFQILDFDSVEVGNPPLVTATGMSAGVRHLATPTTMIDYQAGHVASENRPATYTGGIGVRQYAPSADGAVHASVTRAINRGTITTDTSYGQVDAWIADISWLQNLWRGAIGKVGYRYYREEETTRAYEDLKQTGTDMMTAGLSHEFKKGEVASAPVTLDMTYARYLTNVNVAATSLELGIGAKF